jgi:hypothetical protein
VKACHRTIRRRAESDGPRASRRDSRCRGRDDGQRSLPTAVVAPVGGRGGRKRRHAFASLGLLLPSFSDHPCPQADSERRIAVGPSAAKPACRRAHVRVRAKCRSRKGTCRIAKQPTLREANKPQPRPQAAPTPSPPFSPPRQPQSCRRSFPPPRPQYGYLFLVLGTEFRWRLRSLGRPGAEAALYPLISNHI